MQLSEAALQLLDSSGVQFGEGWARYIQQMNAGDEAQNIIIGDGIIPAKIDGYIHACTLASKALMGYSKEAEIGLDLVRTTSWTGGNQATHFAQWMVDFHWKIDTRTWQFMMYLYAMKWSFRDVFDQSRLISNDDRRDLHRINEDFWAEVVVAYTYRMEVIERSRGFATHPDPTCGASWQGYIYRKIWNREEIAFEDLSLPLIEKGSPAYKPYAGKMEPKPFPTLQGEVQVLPGLPSIALKWFRECKKREIADAYLRVELGDRMVPTRFNGWWSALDELLRFLKPYAKGSRAEAERSHGAAPGLDLTDFAVRFGLCHLAFQKQLRGNPTQLINLIEAVGTATASAWQNESITPEAVASFVSSAVSAIQAANRADLALGEEVLPELKVARPLHPRYAPVDPLEPLPWEVKDVERYQRKMARLGYTL